MKQQLRFLILIFSLFFTVSAFAQVQQWRDIYTAKKKDTVFGIARKYGITVTELMDANPEMKAVGYELKKDDTVFIPHPKPQTATTATPTAVTATPAPAAGAPKPAAKQANTVRVGILLPLHDVDGDGKRMVEYYRGVLMACDSLRQAGINTIVNAWNVPIDADIRQTLLEKNAKDCDLIFGPLYTHQVKYLGDFCKTYGIKMVIPFSINGSEVTRNPQIFQVYQTPEKLNNDAIEAFLKRFGNHHPVFIDCNDTTSRKGIFTFGLRKELDKRGVKYNITNLKSSEEMFAKAFSKTQPNVVILNTGRSPELTVAFSKLNGMAANYPGAVVSLFGYTEWLMYTKYHLDNFFKFDTYIPTTFYYNPLDTRTQQLEQGYRKWFKAEMQYAYPRFAIMGYDQAQFFIRGIQKYGDSFKGTAWQRLYKPLQTPLLFKQVDNAGMQNTQFMLIHYTYGHQIESIQY